MAKLAVWSRDARNEETGSTESKPRRVGRSHVGLEKELEDWIVNDVSLIGEGLTLVGRQVTIDDGRLDLLAIDSEDRWVVIEVKPGLLQSGALHQALYYASSLARLDADELRGKLDGNKLSEFGDKSKLSERLKQQLENDEEPREIALMLVGAGISAGVQRMNEFVGRFGIPIEIVSFEVFKLENGTQLLIRDVIEEPAEPTARKPKLTVEMIRNMARDAGVEKQFNRFVSMSEQAGLPVQPQRRSVRIAPPQNKTRFLMYARPHSDASGAGLWIYAGGAQFVEFFPEIDEQAAMAVGREEDGGYFAGKQLDERLDQIQSFLTMHFPRSEADEA